MNEDNFVAGVGSVFGYNMFAYCNNNPVMCIDGTGHFPRMVYLCVADMGYSVKKTPSIKPSTTTTTTADPSKNYNDYLKALRKRESSNNYSATNQYGYLGAYQMGKMALQDAGFMNKSGTWTSLANSYGVYSVDDFLNTPHAQDVAITACNKKVCGYIKYYGLTSYIGTSYCGVTVTRSGLLAACHLVGIGSVKRALTSGEKVTDANGVAASEYMSLFADYDISEVW